MEDEAIVRFRNDMGGLMARARDLTRAEVTASAAQLLDSLRAAVPDPELQGACHRRVLEFLFDDALTRNVSVDEAETLLRDLLALDEPDRIHKATFPIMFGRYCRNAGEGGRALQYLQQAETEITASKDLGWDQSQVESTLWHLRLCQAYLVDEPLDACEARLRKWLGWPRGPEERAHFVRSFADYCRYKGEPKRASPFLEDAARALSESSPEDLTPSAPKAVAMIRRYLTDLASS